MDGTKNELGSTPEELEVAAKQHDGANRKLRKLVLVALDFDRAAQGLDAGNEALPSLIFLGSEFAFLGNDALNAPRSKERKLATGHEMPLSGWPAQEELH